MSQPPPHNEPGMFGGCETVADRQTAEVVALLRETFGAKVSFRVRLSQWMDWRGGAEPSANHERLAAGPAPQQLAECDADLEEQLHLLFEEVVSRGAPVWRAQGNGRYLLLLPCPALDGCPMVAVAPVYLSPEEVFGRWFGLVG